jgi:hypothetical protein
MALISEYSIVIYERKPGCWRAAITPKGRIGVVARGDQVLSSVTPDDSASESDANVAAVRLIRAL